jgi:hypothetical protein
MTKRYLIGAALLLAAGFVTLASFVGCKKNGETDSEAQGPPWFSDVTKELGIHFIHDGGPKDGLFFMPQQVGSGMALFDFDGDGLLDLYLMNNGGPKGRPNQLFKQMKDGTFKNVSKGSNLDFADHCMGVAVGDFNNDGKPDLLVTMYGGVRLFLNLGNGKFKDVTKAAGLNNPAWTTSAAFLDYDRDGWLDLVIVNYVDYDKTLACTGASGLRDYCAPKASKPIVSKLYRNLGKQADGTIKFQDVSLTSNIGRKPGPGLGVIVHDFDGDGYPDIFVANDGMANHLWMNQRDGTFVEEAVQRGVAYNAMGVAEANMGIGLGDVDGDGMQDLFVTHLSSETNTLWIQGPRGAFRDQTAQTRMNRPKWRATGFGTVLGDFDQNGWLDAVVLNGRVARQKPVPDSPLGPFWSMYGERNQVFVNDGKGQYLDRSLDNPAVCGYENVGRSLAMGVLDPKTGILFLVAQSIDGPTKIFRTVAPNRGHWLLVRAVDPKHGSRDSLGAELTLHTGGRKFVRTVQASGGYLCANDSRQHFGLGQNDKVDFLHVIWPDGKSEEFSVPEIDRLITIEQGKGRPAK